MVLEIQFSSANYTLFARICKNNANNKAKAVHIRFKVNENVLNTSNTAKHYFSTILPVILRTFIKMGRMDEEQAVFEQLTLSDFKK